MRSMLEATSKDFPSINDASSIRESAKIIAALASERLAFARISSDEGSPLIK
ncbi:hypothetical protein D3C81_2236800 [compost metagenome]